MSNLINGELSFQSETSVRGCVILAVSVLVACGAPQVTPVPLSQPDDAALTCEQIAAEIAGNQAEARRLVDVEGDVDAGNVLTGMAAGGLVGGIPMAFLISDMEAEAWSTEQIQYRALRDRNINLSRLQQQKGC